MNEASRSDVSLILLRGVAMSTCIVCLDGVRGAARAYSIARTFIADGDVFFEDFGRTKYQRHKLFFSFLSGNENSNGQVICLMAVGCANASAEFLERLTNDVQEGEMPAWELYETRRKYGDLTYSNDYELFVNVFDCLDSGLYERAFIVGKSSTGFYTYDVKDDMSTLGAHGIGVDGAKMVIALDAFRYATERTLSQRDLALFFNRWSTSLRETGYLYAVGRVDLRMDESDYDERRYIDFTMSPDGCFTDQTLLGSIAETDDGAFIVQCDGLHGPNQMVSYSVEGEVAWNGCSSVPLIDFFDDEYDERRT